MADDLITFEVDYRAEDMPVEKDAKIFEAGEYPDKGITVSEDDLDTIVRNFRESPVKVEHTDSPLDPLGVVKRIWRKGRELFARLAFPADVAGFLERRGIRRLSIALSRDPLRLAEVSLVLSPRVASAVMFGEKPSAISREQSASEGQMALPLEEREESTVAAPLQPAEPSGPEKHPRIFRLLKEGGKSHREEVSEAVSEDATNTSTSEADKEREIAELRFALREKDVDARLAALKAQGKIVPASEGIARAILLQADQTVTFADAQSTASELFLRFLETQPKVIEFSELAPGGGSAPATPASEDDELLARLGVTRELVKKYER